MTAESAKPDGDGLKSLNPAHLKALLGQEVMMTLSDATTRQGIVYSLDPESFTVVLVTGGAAATKASLGGPRADECVVVPGHAVRAVEVVGGSVAALGALSANSTAAWLRDAGENTPGDAMTKAMRSMSGSRQNSWGAQSNYAGMAALLKPSAGAQLECVKKCFRENKVPFIERTSREGPGDVELVALGSLIVRYPYTAEACSCTNEIVLARIRQLISSGGNDMKEASIQQRQ